MGCLRAISPVSHIAHSLSYCYLIELNKLHFYGFSMRWVQRSCLRSMMMSPVWMVSRYRFWGPSRPLPPSAQPVLTANHVCCALLVMQYSQYSVLMLRPLFVTPIVSLICAMELHIYHGVLFALLEQERPLAHRVDFALLCQQMTKS